MENLEVVVAELRAIVAAEARHINARLDRNELHQDARHRESTDRLERIERQCNETNGRVTGHDVRLEEGDKQFGAIWRRLEGLSRRYRAPDDGGQFITRDRVTFFAAGGGSIWGLIELVEWVVR